MNLHIFSFIQASCQNQKMRENVSLENFRSLIISRLVLLSWVGLLSCNLYHFMISVLDFKKLRIKTKCVALGEVIQLKQISEQIQIPNYFPEVYQHDFY